MYLVRLGLRIWVAVHGSMYMVLRRLGSWPHVVARYWAAGHPMWYGIMLQVAASLWGAIASELTQLFSMANSYSAAQSV
jgi:hypothetical protein